MYDVKNSVIRRINSASPRPARRILSYRVFGILSRDKEIKIKLSMLSIISSNVSISKV